MSATTWFDHVRFWIFDLDNTLYPPDIGLFEQVDERMGRFIASYLSVDRVEARRLQKHYYRTHGTTLRGLMTEHGLDPALFLEFVHDIDHSPVRADPVLRAALAALPGRRYILTNGSRAHAEAVARRLDVVDLFDDFFDIAAANYTPKPALEAYRRFIDASGIDPARAAMFEDIPRNLEIPHCLGMTTVLVTTSPGAVGPLRESWEDAGAKAGHIDHVTDDLAHFLTGAAAPALART